ncbi:hypothetical protein PMAYCL1PPCAC_04026, partial [Pristionchus mayeri]
EGRSESGRSSQDRGRVGGRPHRSSRGEHGLSSRGEVATIEWRRSREELSSGFRKEREAHNRRGEGVHCRSR